MKHVLSARARIISQQTVAHALARAASRLLSTPLRPKTRCVGISHRGPFGTSPAQETSVRGRVSRRATDGPWRDRLGRETPVSGKDHGRSRRCPILTTAPLRFPCGRGSVSILGRSTLFRAATVRERWQNCLFPITCVEVPGKSRHGTHECVRY